MQVHQKPGQKGLAGVFSLVTEPAGKPKGEAGLIGAHLQVSTEAQYFIEDTFAHPNRGGDGGAHDIAALIGIAAVTFHSQTVQSALCAVECDGGHGLFPQALTLVISTLV